MEFGSPKTHAFPSCGTPIRGTSSEVISSMDARTLRELARDFPRQSRIDFHSKKQACRLDGALYHPMKPHLLTALVTLTLASLVILWCQKSKHPLPAMNSCIAIPVSTLVAQIGNGKIR
jgi:hypothetical protein